MMCFEKNQDVSDLSESVGYSEDDKDERKEVQKRETSKTKTAETARGFVHSQFDILTENGYITATPTEIL